MTDELFESKIRGAVEDYYEDVDDPIGRRRMLSIIAKITRELDPQELHSGEWADDRPWEGAYE